MLLAGAGIWLARQVTAVAMAGCSRSWPLPVASALVFFVQQRYLIVAVAVAVVFAGVRALASIPGRVPACPPGDRSC